MSDTEQHKKRKLEETAEAVDIKQQVVVQESANAGVSEILTTERSTESDQQQIAREKEKIMTLLEPFSREQLVEILTSAASQYDNIYNEIKTVASADVAHRKVFIRGLAWETTTETLKDAFSMFGEVEEGAVIYDKATSKSKGFGFVTFVDMDAAQRAIAKQTVEIDGRRATCNLAALRPHSDDHHQPSASHHQQQHQRHQQQQHNQPHQQPRAVTQQLPTGQAHTVYTTPAANQMYSMVGMQVPMQQQQPPQHQHPHYQPQQQIPASGGPSDEADRKLFVRGLSWDTSNDTFRAEFQKFGELEEAMVAIDRKTGKSKGFGFITYKHKASADRALQQPQKTIDGRTTTCNLASQGGSRGGGNDRHSNSGGMGGGAGGGSNGYPGAMMPVMPASVPAYAVPMYTTMPSPYGGVPPPQLQQPQPVQYSAYPAMAADPYNPQTYGAVAAPPQAAQYYQNRPPPGYQQPKPPAPQRK